jgi:uncharacterized protein YbbK (DUF523 family)
MSEPRTGMRVCVSACLLGRCTRYDGTHRRCEALSGGVTADIEWVPVCPEHECGLGTPREPMHLESAAHRLRLLTNTTRRDHTETLRRWCARAADRLHRDGVSAFVLKSRSPSCGLGTAPCTDRDGAVCPPVDGLFAAAMARKFPTHLFIDESALGDSAAVAAFIDRIHAHSTTG